MKENYSKYKNNCSVLRAGREMLPITALGTGTGPLRPVVGTVTGSGFQGDLSNRAPANIPQATFPGLHSASKPAMTLIPMMSRVRNTHSSPDKWVINHGASLQSHGSSMLLILRNSADILGWYLESLVPACF